MGRRPPEFDLGCGEPHGRELTLVTGDDDSRLTRSGPGDEKVEHADRAGLIRTERIEGHGQTAARSKRVQLS